MALKPCPKPVLLEGTIAKDSYTDNMGIDISIAWKSKHFILFQLRTQIKIFLMHWGLQFAIVQFPVCVFTGFLLFRNHVSFPHLFMGAFWTERTPLPSINISDHSATQPMWDKSHYSALCCRCFLAFEPSRSLLLATHKSTLLQILLTKSLALFGTWLPVYNGIFSEVIVSSPSQEMLLKKRSWLFARQRKYMETWTHVMHFKWEVTRTHGT